MNKMHMLVQKLRSPNANLVLDALTDIKRNYIQEMEKRAELEKYSILQEVISLIDHPKYCSISISIIADACVQKYWIPEITKKGGITCLSRIMCSLINSKIQNRACRALGNVAKNGYFKEIQNKTLVKSILKFLSDVEETTFKQNALRTLRYIGAVSQSRDIIIHENGIYCIAKLLQCSDKNLISCCIQTLAILTENCGESCFEQFVKASPLINFINMYKDTESDVKINVLKSLKNISYHELARPMLIKVGAVQLFLGAAIDLMPLDNRKMAILGLCNCLNYMHMFLNYGTTRKDALKSLVEALRLIELKEIHFDIVSALLPLTFEQENVDILIELELVAILTERLKIFLKNYQIPHENSQILSKTRTSINSETQIRMSSFHSKLSKNINKPNHTPGDIEKRSNKKVTLKRSSKNINNPFTMTNFSSSKNFSSIPCQSSNYLKKNNSICSSPYSPTSCGSNAAESPNNFSDCFFEWPKSVPHVTWSPCESSYSPTKNIYNDEDNIVNENNLLCLKETPTSKITIEYKKNSKCLVSKSNYDSSISAEPQKGINYDIKCKNKMREDLESHQCWSEKKANKRFKTCKFINTNENLSYNENYQNLTSNSSVFKNEQVIDMVILSLLFRLSFHLGKKSNSELASKSCFSVLLQYISSIPNANSNAEKILLELVKNRYCFEKLIMNGFVFEMDALLKTVHDIDDCKHCLCIHSVHQTLIQNLSQEIESDYGVGTICHILCKSEKLSKFYAIYSTSKLVSSKTAFQKILKQANGLSFIFEILSDTSVVINTHSILCLCQIYQNLYKVKKSLILKNCCIFQTCNLNLTTKCAYKEDNLNVTFVVDNDVAIFASREKLCCSDFFRALLKGHFKESEENVIKICDISAETMTTIFHFLHGCYSDEYCPYIKRIPFEVLLELIGSSERFLLSNIKMFVTDQLCHTLSPETVSKIYWTAKMYDFVDLYKKCIQYILCLDLSKSDIVHKCFQDMNFCDLVVLNDIQSEIDFLLNS